MTSWKDGRPDDVMNGWFRPRWMTSREVGPLADGVRHLGFRGPVCVAGVGGAQRILRLDRLLHSLHLHVQTGLVKDPAKGCVGSRSSKAPPQKNLSEKSHHNLHNTEVQQPLNSTWSFHLPPHTAWKFCGILKTHQTNVRSPQPHAVSTLTNFVSHVLRARGTCLLNLPNETFALPMLTG